MSAIYALTKVRKHYASRRAQAVNIERLAIQRGEVLAVVGPSGAGKSTLLRLLGLIEPPTAGSIEFDDERFDEHSVPALSARRKVTSVFQRPLPLSQNVFENVAYGLRIRGQRDVNAPVQKALNAVGLDALARAQARTLSGGELQRVALARALVLGAPVLLLDEPTANLDPANTLLIERAISATNREAGTTIIMVTHNIFQARRLAQRLALMLEGAIVEAGDTARMFDTPSDPRTAAFLRGDMVW